MVEYRPTSSLLLRGEHQVALLLETPIKITPRTRAWRFSSATPVSPSSVRKASTIDCDRHDAVVEAEALGQVGGVVLGVLRRVLAGHRDRRRRSRRPARRRRSSRRRPSRCRRRRRAGPSGSRSCARSRAGPDDQRARPRSTGSSAVATSAGPSARTARPRPETTTWTTPAVTRAGVDRRRRPGRGRRRGRSSTNCGAGRGPPPSVPTTIESPSKTSSSCPPTMFRYASGQPACAARRRTSSSRVSSLSRSYGEPLMHQQQLGPGVAGLRRPVRPPARGPRRWRGRRRRRAPGRR